MPWPERDGDSLGQGGKAVMGVEILLMCFRGRWRRHGRFKYIYVYITFKFESEQLSR